MFSTSLPTIEKMPSKLDEKFDMKIKHNFKLQVLLYLRGFNWSRESILVTIFQLDGYKRHKVVKYGAHWSHLHIKFEEEQYAKQAITVFNESNSEFTAIVVDDLLRTWHSFETRCMKGPTWTHTIVDIVGKTPTSMNFLTENVLNYLFEDFGRPFILPYTAAFKEVHLQVLFYSMTEALAACMSFGQWYVGKVKAEDFFYRVRINPSKKEATLIEYSEGVPEEAFKLDYFVSERNEINLNTESIGCIGKPKDVPPNRRGNTYQNKGAQRGRKQKQRRDCFRPHDFEDMKYRTPIICIPVVDHFYSSYAQALMPVGNPVNTTYAGPIVNVGPCPQPGSLVETGYEVLSYSSVYENAAMVESPGNTTQQTQPLTDEPTMTTYVSNSSQLLPTQSKPPRQVQRQKKTFRLSSRTFERR